MSTLSNPKGIEHIANLEDVELSYTRAGKGAPVVLVHGSVVDGRVWSGHSNALAATFDVVVPTQRYFGIRAWTDEGTNFSVRHHAKNLAMFLKYLDVGPVTCVGWSYGAAVVLNAVVDNPELFRQLVLHEPAMASHIESAPAQDAAGTDRHRMFAAAQEHVERQDYESAVEAFIDGVNDKPGTFQSLDDPVKKIMRDSARTLPLLFAAPPPAVRAAHLRGIRCPTKISVGSKSRAFFQVATRAAAEAIPNAQLDEITGGRHMWPVEHSEECIAYLRDSI